MRHNIQFPIYIILAFMLFTIIGTQSHELGHIAAARYLGYETTLSYGSMTSSSEESRELSKLTKEKWEARKANIEFEKEARYTELQAKVLPERLWITLGGPLQTMLTGTLALLILSFWQQRDSSKLLFWILVLTTLFWVREPFNLVTGLFSEFVLGNKPSGDEIILAYRLVLPKWSIAISLGILGFLICTYTIFKFVPRERLFSFLLGGLIGGILGFFFWFHFLGPLLFPH